MTPKQHDRLFMAALITLTTLCLLFLLSAIARAQTNPCQAPVDTFVLNPTTVAFESPDHDAVVVASTTPLVQSYSLEILLKGASSPVTSIPIQRTAMTKVAGTTPPCYTAPLGDPTTIPGFPVAQELVSRVVAVGTVGVGNSLPSTNSNPFGWQGPPRGPNGVRVKRP